MPSNAFKCSHSPGLLPLRIPVVAADEACKKGHLPQNSTLGTGPELLSSSLLPHLPNFTFDLLLEELVQDLGGFANAIFGAEAEADVASRFDESSLLSLRGCTLKCLSNGLRLHLADSREGQAGAGSSDHPRVLELIEAARCHDAGPSTSQASSCRSNAAVMHDGTAARKKPFVGRALDKDDVLVGVVEELLRVRLICQIFGIQFGPTSQDDPPHLRALEASHREGRHVLAGDGEHGAPANVGRRVPRCEEFVEAVDV
mmetsp:Transcript_82723/g.173183  ORF Transcript_82723/g.173183 Transcript_82723/m.173183 type:complete len:258 (+) Transcript_82723:29-802(+)